MKTENNQTLAALIQSGSQQLLNISDSAKLDAQLLLGHVLKKPTTYLYTWPDVVATNEQTLAFEKLLTRRKSGEPIAYIIGEKEFWSLTLKVSLSTLIPRPDTEILVERILAIYEAQYGASLKCLDLGTGTGAIALALASEMPHWQFDAVDFQASAVALAKDNAKTLNITNVNVYQSDWFSQISADKCFDIIVSNPPYIDKDDHHLVQGDVKFEPKSALVADDEGYSDIRDIADIARKFLAPNGGLFFEHGFEQAVKVREILVELGYENVQTAQDLSGNDRITWAFLPAKK